MRTSGLRRVFSLAFLLPALMLFPVSLSQAGASGISLDYSHYTIDYTVTSDGQYAWVLMSVSADGDTSDLFVRLVNLADETIVEEYRVPNTDTLYTRLFTQGNAVYLAAPLGKNDDCTWVVYELEQGKAPALLSDTLHTLSCYTKPVQWQNRLILMGASDQDRMTMMFLENEKLRTVDLEESYPKLAGEIEKIYPPSRFADEAMPLYWIKARNSYSPRIGLWLQPSGLPPLATSGNEQGFMAEFIPLYYTQDRMLGLQGDKNKAMRLGTFDPADLVDPADLKDWCWSHNVNIGGFAYACPRHEIKLLKAPELYNSDLHYLDRTTVLAVGTKTSSSDSDLLVYLYDCTTGSLTSLPADSFGSVFADPDSHEIGIWKAGDVLFAKVMSGARATTGVVVNLANGASTAISSDLFENSAPPASWFATSEAPTTDAASSGSTDVTAERRLGDTVAWLALLLALASAVVVGVVRYRRRESAASGPPSGTRDIDDG